MSVSKFYVSKLCKRAHVCVTVVSAHMQLRHNFGKYCYFIILWHVWHWHNLWVGVVQEPWLNYSWLNNQVSPQFIYPVSFCCVCLVLAACYSIQIVNIEDKKPYNFGHLLRILLAHTWQQLNSNEKNKQGENERTW